MVKINKTVYYCISSELISKNEIDIIKKASKYGDVIIGLLTDEAIAEYKRIPFLNYEERFQVISNIKNVKKVVPQKTRDYKKNLEKFKPNYVVHEDNFWKVGIQKKIRSSIIKTLKKWNGKLIEIKSKNENNNNIFEEKIDSVNDLPQTRLSKLKRLIQVKDIVKVMEVHSPISALMVEKLSIENKNKIKEFEAFWSSSLTDSVLRGKPDNESVDISSRIQTVNDIFEVTTKPLIFDADTGGKPEHIGFVIKNLERLGVSAAIIEDKIGLKRNSLFGNKVRQKQDSISNFCKKIRIAKNAQKTKEFMLIARIESLILEAGIEDALTRAARYIKAGADAIMIHSKNKNPSEIKNFCKKYNLFSNRRPLVLVPTTYNSIKESELVDLKVNVVIYANHLMRSAIPSIKATALSILKHERSLEIDNKLMSIDEILNIIPGTKN